MNGFRSHIDGPSRNALLAALPGDARERLERVLEPVFMAPAQVLYEPGALLQCVYFPTSAVVALLYLLADGASDEIAVVGQEGVVGVTLVLGGERASDRAVVEHAGWVYRLRRREFEQECARGGALQQLLLRYVHALSMQIAQLAICNRHHTVDQHLCRWLLAMLDRQESDRLQVTHEQIADRIGVRRGSVTEAAGRLLRAGIIRLDRGSLTVLDRRGLEALSCECYGVVRRASARLLAVPGPARPTLVLAPSRGQPVPETGRTPRPMAPARPPDVFGPRCAAALR